MEKDETFTKMEMGDNTMPTASSLVSVASSGPK
jgi:hypothetical protein